MESMNAFFSGKAVWYGGTGTGAPITGNPAGGSGSGSSFVPGYDENGVYIDMEVVGDTSRPPLTLVPSEYSTVYADGMVEHYSADGRLYLVVMPDRELFLRHVIAQHIPVIAGEEFESIFPVIPCQRSSCSIFPAIPK